VAYDRVKPTYLNLNNTLKDYYYYYYYYYYDYYYY
jgi:hypothetical protein